MLTVILAGGRSSRMGQDKAQLRFQDDTMLQGLIQKYSAALGPVAVSVDRAGRFPFSNAMELVDRYPGMGPLNGIVSAFTDTDEQEIFLTATDLPLGDPLLAKRLAAMRSAADACLIRLNDRMIEPLFAVYGAGCLLPAISALESGHRSFYQLLERLCVRYAAPEELSGFDLETILWNVNTPAEYAQLRTKPGSGLQTQRETDTAFQ